MSFSVYTNVPGEFYMIRSKTYHADINKEQFNKFNKSGSIFVPCILDHKILDEHEPRYNCSKEIFTTMQTALNNIEFERDKYCLDFGHNVTEAGKIEVYNSKISYLFNYYCLSYFKK